MRFTPAGIEVFEAVLHHRSEVVEAGKVRKLEFDFNAVSYGALARRLNGMEIGAEIQFKGFLAPKSMRNPPSDGTHHRNSNRGVIQNGFWC